ncbi:MAG: hypothetical protein Q7J51_01430 [Sheuella sp.]|nr:hypothetical protein [Sheuella sp.]
MHDERILKQLPARVNADSRLCWRGRHVDTAFLIECGQEQFLVKIKNGCIESVSKGVFASSEWCFALRASGATWSAFWQALPVPGYHDIMAMLKFKYLKMEGDLYPLMSHLLYFKDVLAAARLVGSHA